LSEIRNYRKKVDEIDEKILDLLSQRANLAIKIGDIKRKNSKKIHSPKREKEIYEKLFLKNKGPLGNESIKYIYREIISASLALEEPIKISFLGPEASFTHLACIQQFGLSLKYHSADSIKDVFDDVEKELVKYGVVPVENSTEGAINLTLDMFLESDLKICGEILLPINHNLLNKTGNIKDVKQVVSHPQSIAQCREWLEKHLNGIPLTEVSSNSRAAIMASENKSMAAIASSMAAVLYGLKIIKRNIEDNVNNFTRFLIIGKNSSERTGDDKTSLIFSVKDKAGVLHEVLRPFAENKINLTKIESRPLKKKAWKYIFYLDLLGHLEDLEVKKAIKSLKSKCIFLKILGSYPRAKQN